MLIFIEMKLSVTHVYMCIVTSNSNELHDNPFACLLATPSRQRAVSQSANARHYGIDGMYMRRQLVRKNGTTDEKSSPGGSSRLAGHMENGRRDNL